MMFSYTQLQFEGPYDTLFLLSPRQTVTSIASALSWLISLLLKNQAFSRMRMLGIHFAGVKFLVKRLSDYAAMCPRSSPAVNQSVPIGLNRVNCLAVYKSKSN